MASLQSRTTKGIKYYSIVESYRDDKGNPRNRIIQYLGTASNIISKLSEGKLIKSYSHGLTLELLKAAQEIEVVELVNKSIANKKIKNGMTVGASLVLSALSRVSGDYSKKGWQEWSKTVSLETILKKDCSNLDSDHFWQHMNCITDQEIEDIQKKLFKKVISLHNCKPETLLLDATNFFTYIDSDNGRCEIAKRGRNKQKRNDLRQVSTVLLVTKEELLPVYHSTYAGNINDVTMFKERIDDIIKNINEIFPKTSLELIFDKGNLSKSNLQILDDSQYLYTTSVPRTWVKTLVKKHSKAISKGQVVDCLENLWEKDRRFIFYRSKGLLRGQLRELRANISKVRAFIKEVNEQPVKRKSRGAKVEDFLEKYRHVADIFLVNTEQNKKLSYKLDLEKINKLIRLQFGIIILTTNSKEKTEAVIKNYQAQYGVESVFSIMKNSVQFRPFYHWTDSKIKAHILICLIAYTLITSIHLRTKKLGTHYSIQVLIHKLESIRIALIQKNKSDKFSYQLEVIEDQTLHKLAGELGISANRFMKKISGFSVYN